MKEGIQAGHYVPVIDLMVLMYYDIPVATGSSPLRLSEEEILEAKISVALAPLMLIPGGSEGGKEAVEVGVKAGVGVLKKEVLEEGAEALTKKVAHQSVMIAREKLLNAVENPKLRNIVSSLYREIKGEIIGSGSAMDAVREELRTGVLVQGKNHSNKIKEAANGLLRLSRRTDVSETDRKIISELLEDINNALSGR